MLLEQVDPQISVALTHRFIYQIYCGQWRTLLHIVMQEFGLTEDPPSSRCSFWLLQFLRQERQRLENHTWVFHCPLSEVTCVIVTDISLAGTTNWGLGK